jgi:hypothetical protein
MIDFVWPCLRSQFIVGVTYSVWRLIFQVTYSPIAYSPIAYSPEPRDW